MAQEQWYMAIGGHQVGPVSQEDVVTNLRNGTIDGNTLVFSAGMANWTPLKDVPALAAYLTSPATRAAAAAAAPPPITPGQRAHEIDFRILGSEMQFVEVELDPGESAVAEAGSMMYMTPGIQMETVFGDGSQQQQRSGVMGALLGAGKRLITGESLFMTVFTNQGAASSRRSRRHIPARSWRWISRSQRHADLSGDAPCAARGVSIGSRSARSASVCWRRGFHHAALEGDGPIAPPNRRTVHPVDLASARSYGSTGAARGAAAVGRLRHPACRQDRATALFGGEGLPLPRSPVPRRGCSRCRSAAWPTVSGKAVRPAGGSRWARAPSSGLAALDGDNSRRDERGCGPSGTGPHADTRSHSRHRAGGEIGHGLLRGWPAQGGIVTVDLARLDNSLRRCPARVHGLDHRHDTARAGTRGVGWIWSSTRRAAVHRR
jgi:uncharacterized protein (AIM24 family)